jgi:hypothetical protein
MLGVTDGVTDGVPRRVGGLLVGLWVGRLSFWPIQEFNVDDVDGISKVRRPRKRR